MKYRVTVIDQERVEHIIHLDANGYMEARDNALAKARKGGIKTTGAASVENLTAIEKWVKDAQEFGA